MNHRRLRGKCSDVNHSEKARDEEESKKVGVSGRDRGCETEGRVAGSVRGGRGGTDGEP
jgi:hypothetical protein